MITSKEETKALYTTLDAYQAGFLTIHQHIPRLVTQGSKIVFVFNASSELFRDLDDYNAEATVSAIRFTLAIKSLKSQIFSKKNSK